MNSSGTTTTTTTDTSQWDAGDLANWQSQVETFLTTNGCRSLSDAERIDAIRAAEELACTLSAAQAALAASLDASVRSERAARGVAAERRGRGVAEQVAHARRESPHRGRQHLGLAKITPTELPHTWAAWCAGRVTEWMVTLIAQETACLPLQHRMRVDELIAADPEVLETMSPQQVRGRCRAEAEHLDPTAVLTRRRYAETQRHVSIRPAPDTMTWVTALLPVKDGVSVYATLTRAADTARTTGDPRTRGQVMADTLVAATLQHQPDSTTGSTTTGENGTPGTVRPGVQLHLLMSDTALFGDTDAPARLDGYGPIPAELAREIITNTLDSDESVWVRRLFTDPTTGALAGCDPRARRFPATLARLIRLRDGVCRTPWCDAPIRHIDHAEPHATGGATTLSNGQGLCEACNYAKQAEDWHTRPDRHGEIITTMPTGHQYATRPPTLATIRTGAPPITIDYILTG